MGMADTHLQDARATVARAAAADGGGKAHDFTLYALDAAGGTLDPAFDAHILPIKHWALAHWQQWTAREELASAFVSAAARLQRVTRTAWEAVTGPSSALIASLWRIGWTIVAPTRFLTDEGRPVDVCVDPPAAIVIIVRRSVRRWQLCRVAEHCPSLVPPALDYGDVNLEDYDDVPSGRFDPPPLPVYHPRHVRLPKSVKDFTTVIGKLLYAKRLPQKIVPGFDHKHRPYLRSTMAGGQWPQQRVAQVARTDVDPTCRLCRLETGTLLHRRQCSAVVPENGWPKLAAPAQALLDGLEPSRRHLLLTRGLFVARVYAPSPPDHGWLRWVLPLPPDFVGEGTWYTDGSLVDGTVRGIARTGFALAFVDNDGELLAYGLGMPPAWIDTAPSAEAWAYLMALQACPFHPARGHRLLGGTAHPCLRCLGRLRRLEAPGADLDHDLPRT